MVIFQYLIKTFCARQSAIFFKIAPDCRSRGCVNGVLFLQSLLARKLWCELKRFNNTFQRGVSRAANVDNHPVGSLPGMTYRDNTRKPLIVFITIQQRFNRIPAFTNESLNSRATGQTVVGGITARLTRGNIFKLVNQCRGPFFFVCGGGRITRGCLALVSPFLILKQGWKRFEKWKIVFAFRRVTDGMTSRSQGRRLKFKSSGFRFGFAGFTGFIQGNRCYISQVVITPHMCTHASVKSRPQETCRQREKRILFGEKLCTFPDQSGGRKAKYHRGFCWCQPADI